VTFNRDKTYLVDNGIPDISCNEFSQTKIGTLGLDLYYGLITLNSDFLGYPYPSSFTIEKTTSDSLVLLNGSSSGTQRFIFKKVL